MRLCILQLAIVVTVLVGCKDEGNSPSEIPTSGRVQLTTTPVNNKPSGFSFPLASIITIPNALNTIPDLLVLVHIEQSGRVVGVFFAAESFRPAFRLLKEFSTSDSAQSYFRNLNEVPDSLYTELAIPVRRNQIWAFKTRDSKFAKMNILATVAYEDTSRMPSNFYGEATFDWAYQPNGSRRF